MNLWKVCQIVKLPQTQFLLGNNSVSRGINPNFWSPIQFQRSQNYLKLRKSRMRNHILNINLKIKIKIKPSEIKYYKYFQWIGTRNYASRAYNTDFTLIRDRGKFATIREQSPHVSHIRNNHSKSKIGFSLDSSHIRDYHYKMVGIPTK